MVRTRLHASRLLGAVFVLAHVGAGASVWPLSVHWPVKLALIVSIIASLAHALWRSALLRAETSIVELEVKDRERASIRTRLGEWREAKILGTSCVTATLTAINLRVSGSCAPEHVLLVPDNVDPEAFRQIRVLLRWARPSDAALSRVREAGE